MDNYNSQYDIVDSRQAPLSVGQYMLTLFLMGLPIAGFILTLVWAFSSDTNINKKNLCRAQLIFLCIIIGIYIIAIVFAIVLGNSLSK